MKRMKKLFSLQTKENCRKLLAISLCLMLLFSCIAQLISCDFGKVKISSLTIDVRGAELDIDLYTPAGVKTGDNLPCVLLAHGRGATKNVVRGVAEELAHRGYVVLNVNAYGMGASEQPVADEMGGGAENWMLMGNPFGMLDALNYARTLSYVDPTRIAMYGHSFGSMRSATVAAMDCGYLTLNDILINVLADNFGQSFTEEEIAQNADELAAARLSPEELAWYENIKAEKTAQYNSRLNTIVLAGAGGQNVSGIAVVAGHEVSREVQVNVAFVLGKYDSLGAGAMWSKDGSQTVLGQPLNGDFWYRSENFGESFAPIGALNEVTIDNSPELKSALDSRSARIVCYNSESHSKNYFSSASNADTISIINQALGVSGAKSPSSQTWFTRACFNFAALIAMLASLLFLTALLLKTKYFAPCVGDKIEGAAPVGKKEGLVLAVLTVVFTVLCLLKANSGGPVWANPFGTRWFANILKLVTTSAIAVWFVIWLTLASAVILAIKLFLAKKAGNVGIKALNLAPGFSRVLKTILLAVIVIAFANFQLVVIERVFNQDFRFWQLMFGEMKAEQWFEVALPYMILFLPCYLIIGMAINHGVDDTIPESKDMVKTIVINSLGVWGLCLFCYIMWFVNWKGAAISDFTLSYSMLTFVPLTVYITRKMYKLTNSVWLGALLNSMLLAWTLTCSAGVADKYYGQSFLSILFGV